MGLTLRYLERWADHTDPEKLRITPLHQAAFEGKLVEVKRLIKQGANINVRDKKGWTPLQDAVVHNRVAICKFLISSGSKTDLVDKEFGYTALHEAVRSEYKTICRLLLDAGAKLTIKDNEGLTPFELAKLYDLFCMVKLLERAFKKNVRT